MQRTAPDEREVARALWLLGLERGPASSRELQAAWRARVALAHPDRAGSRTTSAHTLTAAFNAARDLLTAWQATGRPWPAPAGPGASVREAHRRAPAPDEPPPPRSRRPAAPLVESPPKGVEADRFVAARNTGLRPGDSVREVGDRGPDAITHVDQLEAEDRWGPVWVTTFDGRRRRAGALRLAGFACPACGDWAEPLPPIERPCPACLADLRRLHDEPTPVGVRTVARGVAARALAGRTAARSLRARASRGARADPAGATWARGQEARCEQRRQAAQEALLAPELADQVRALYRPIHDALRQWDVPRHEYDRSAGWP